MKQSKQSQPQEEPMKNKLNILLFMSLFCLVSCKSLTQKKVETTIKNMATVEKDVKTVKKTVSIIKQDIAKAEKQAKKSIETKDHTLCPLGKITDIKQQLELADDTIIRIDNNIFYLKEDMEEIKGTAKDEIGDLKNKLLFYQIIMVVMVWIFTCMIISLVRYK